MNKLLAQIVDAHGGINRLKGYEKVEATIVSGGGFFPLRECHKIQPRAA